MTAELDASWEARGPIDPAQPARGARLEFSGHTGNELYEAQNLYSTYVHVDPEAAPFPPSNLFFRREIVPRVRAARYSHALAVVTLLLLEAAVVDTAVGNARFVLLSDSDAPLYHAGPTWLQALLERRSRVCMRNGGCPVIGPEFVRALLLNRARQSVPAPPLLP